MRLIDWRGHGDDDEIGGLERTRVEGGRELAGGLELGAADFASGVDMLQIGVDLGLRQIEADGGMAFAKGHGQGQADIAQTDDSDGSHRMLSGIREV